MKEHYDLAIVGAGPAGLAAAALAGELGLATLLLDEQPQPGGQVYRHIETAPAARREVLGPDYAKGDALAAAMRTSAVDYVADAAAWRLGPGGELGLSRNGTARVVSAETVIVATGAIERPCPIPGWTLPGVMTAGAAQTLLKASGMVAEGAVFAGSGPLLYLAAAQYAAAGVMVHAVLDTTPTANYAAAARFLPEALMAGSYLAKGLGLMAALRRRGIRIIGGVDDLRATGTNCVDGVEYRRKGRWSSIETGHLFLHQGIVPNLNLAHAAGCELRWDEGQLCFRPVVDEWGGSSIDGLYIAGDGAGIGGAAVAALRGRLTVLGTAGLTVTERDRRAAPIRAALNKDLHIR
ncbi:MAG: FAD-dependent oxidoreductase, partial [Alphaproteobacteria bacterium]